MCVKHHKCPNEKNQLKTVFYQTQVINTTLDTSGRYNFSIIHIFNKFTVNYSWWLCLIVKKWKRGKNKVSSHTFTQLCTDRSQQLSATHSSNIQHRSIHTGRELPRDLTHISPISVLKLTSRFKITPCYILATEK